MLKRHHSDFKYAIYGGSFDPIHRAHVSLAYYATRELDLDELYFVPTYVNPFKQGSKTTPGEDRLNMIESILHYDKSFRVSDVEVKKGGPSYTYETVQHFMDNLDGELHFLCGWDSLLQIDSWYKGDELLRNITLVTGRRPGADDHDGMEKIKEFREKYGTLVYVLDFPPVDLSATQIRNNVKEGKPIHEMVLPEVEEYIREHQLYK